MLTGARLTPGTITGIIFKIISYGIGELSVPYEVITANYVYPGYHYFRNFKMVSIEIV